MVEIVKNFILKRWDRKFQQVFCLILQIFQFLIETINLISIFFPIAQPDFKMLNN